MRVCARSHTFAISPPYSSHLNGGANLLLGFLQFIYQWTAVSPKVPHLFDLSIVPFTGTLVVIEALLFWYWTSLRLGQILLYGSAAGAVAVVTGKWALAAMGERRLGRS